MNRALLTRPEVERKSYHKANPSSGKMGGDIFPSIEGEKISPLPQKRRVLNLNPDVTERRKAVSALDLESQALGLTAADRQALLDRLALSLQDGQPSRDSRMWVASVVRALAARHSAGDASGYGPAVAQRTLGTASVFKPVQAFAKSAGFDSLQVVERQAAFHYLAELLVDYAAVTASAVRQPLTLKFVGNCCANVAGVFDQAFPGYLAAGLARIIFRRVSADRDWEGDRGIAA